MVLYIFCNNTMLVSLVYISKSWIINLCQDKKIALFKKYKCNLLLRDLNCYQFLFNDEWVLENLLAETKVCSLEAFVCFLSLVLYNSPCFPFGLGCQETQSQVYSSVTVTVLSFVVKIFVSFSFSGFNFCFNRIHAHLYPIALSLLNREEAIINK